MGHIWFLLKALIFSSPCILRALLHYRAAQIVRAASIHLFLPSVIICWLVFKHWYDLISFLLIWPQWLSISCKILIKIHSTQSFLWSSPPVFRFHLISHRSQTSTISTFVPLLFLFPDLCLLCLFSFECLLHLSIYPVVLLLLPSLWNLSSSLQLVVISCTF